MRLAESFLKCRRQLKSACINAPFLALALSVSVAACEFKKTPPLTRGPLSSGCRYGDPSACPSGQICVHRNAAKTECIPRYIGPTPLIPFPIAPPHAVRCTQGPEEPWGPESHSQAETLHALDLSPPSGQSKTVIHAALTGTVLLSTSCTSSSGKPIACPHEEAGTTVRILSPRGFLIFYSGLSQVFVQQGQQVESGHKIGLLEQTEGKKAPLLHFSVHSTAMESWASTLAFYRERPGFLPSSIPFETQFCDPTVSGKCLRKRARVARLPCNAGDPALLRADWRN